MGPGTVAVTGPLCQETLTHLSERIVQMQSAATQQEAAECTICSCAVEQLGMAGHAAAARGGRPVAPPAPPPAMGAPTVDAGYEPQLIALTTMNPFPHVPDTDGRTTDKSYYISPPNDGGPNTTAYTMQELARSATDSTLVGRTLRVE